MALTTDTQSGVTSAAYDNVKDTFPASTDPTAGTVTVTATQLQLVTGVSTEFLTDFKVGDYIWFTTTDEIRRIQSISSDTEMTLQHPISGAVAGVAFKVASKVGYRTISWANDSTGVSNINGVAMVANLSATIDTTHEAKALLIDSTIGGGIVNVIAE